MKAGEHKAFVRDLINIHRVVTTGRCHYIHPCHKINTPSSSGSTNNSSRFVTGPVQGLHRKPRAALAFSSCRLSGCVFTQLCVCCRWGALEARRRMWVRRRRGKKIKTKLTTRTRPTRSRWSTATPQTGNRCRFLGHRQVLLSSGAFEVPALSAWMKLGITVERSVSENPTKKRTNYPKQRSGPRLLWSFQLRHTSANWVFEPPTSFVADFTVI